MSGAAAVSVGTLASCAEALVSAFADLGVTLARVLDSDTVPG
jgi:hypothetical protein